MPLDSKRRDEGETGRRVHLISGKLKDSRVDKLTVIRIMDCESWQIAKLILVQG